MQASPITGFILALDNINSIDNVVHTQQEFFPALEGLSQALVKALGTAHFHIEQPKAARGLEKFAQNLVEVFARGSYKPNEDFDTDDSSESVIITPPTFSKNGGGFQIASLRADDDILSITVSTFITDRPSTIKIKAVFAADGLDSDAGGAVYRDTWLITISVQ